MHMHILHLAKVELPEECMTEIDVLHEQFRNPCSHYHSKQAAPSTSSMHLL